VAARLAFVRLLTFGSIVAALLLVIAAGGLALAGHRVSGSSMQPTLVDGELFVANPFDHRPARFDVVLLRSGEGGTGTQELVKRVIGLPGDRIEIAPGTGGAGPVIRVSPAGSAFWSELRWADGPAAGVRRSAGTAPVGPVSKVPSEVGAHPWRTRIECCTSDGRTSSQPRPATAPAGTYFVLGDNPDASIDSRTFGFTAPDAVRGIVTVRLWPISALPDFGHRLEPASR
jgi:signal peptidase I